MLCTRCKKRQAVVFITGVFGDNKTENAGLCLTCAHELGIPQVEDVMRHMGLDLDDDSSVEDIENRLSELAESGMTPFGGDFGMSMPDFSDDDDEDEDDGFDDDDDDDSESLKNALGSIFASADEDEDEEDEEENDEDGDASDGGSPGKGFPSPFQSLFGSSFSLGGAGYADDSEKAGKKKRNKRRKNSYLENYCTNLTARARAGKIDRIVGRDKEIERIVQILSRRQKNNPCLIGEPGVGKTAIAEGLALRIAAKDVPLRLAEKELYMVDLTALVAGTQFRGQFESRMKGLIDEVRSVGNIILFIDEVHNLVGTGDAEGSMNAANIMKPALSRGELQVIGATTFTEYRKHIEKDAALERRFQPVKVDEPSVSDTVAVLRGIKDYYEKHHGVTVSDQLLARAVSLSERYISDRFLPDKAIDLLDEACACASLRNRVRDELLRAQEKQREVAAEFDKLTEQASSADAQPDYERIAMLRSEKIRLEGIIAELEPQSTVPVTDGDLAHVIELWTGVQASRVEENEYSKLAHLADRMKERIKGQDEACELVAAAIRRTRVQISPRRRPASFIFVGPTGVGKTELVKVLAAELFDTPETLIRLDMSEYMEKYSVSRLIGSPPGYVGYDEAGQLTEKVRRKPYSVLLFDEIEKAHPDVMNILLQILDEGRITDAQGRVVNFENTVIIMTSNAGSNLSGTPVGFAKSENDLAKEKAMKALSDFLRPEFLARVDEVVCFNTLSDSDFIEIARLMCGEYVPALAEKGIELTVDDSAAKWLAVNARGGKSAARDLRNLIRREVEDRLARMIVENTGALPERVTVTADDGGIKLCF